MTMQAITYARARLKLLVCRVVLFCITFSCATAQAQNRQYQFNLVTSTDNMPLGKIMDIVQDSSGYLWMADYTNGLIRYDGYKMTRFRNDLADSNSLRVTDMESLYLTKDGMIWVGGIGLDKFDPRTGKFKHFGSAIYDSVNRENPGINAIIEDRHGVVWVGTSRGLFKLDQKSGKALHIRHDPKDSASLSSDLVRTIYEDRNGDIWIGTGMEFFNDGDGGLNLLTDREMVKFKRWFSNPKDPASLVNNKVRAIFEDSRGNFWIGTGGDGLHTMDRQKGTFKRYPFNSAKPDELSRPALKNGAFADHISFITEDGTGTIWIGTGNAGLNAYDPKLKKVTHLDSSNGFPDKSAWNAFVSRDGVLWITSQWEEKLYRVDPFHSMINHMPLHAPASKIIEDRKGNLWIGTWESGQFERPADHPESLEKISLPEDLAPHQLHNVVLGSYEDRSGLIWMATSDGVQIYNPSSKTMTQVDDVLKKAIAPHTWINAIHEDSQGLLWISAITGLTRLNRKSGELKHFTHSDKDSNSLSSNAILEWMEDKTGNIWLSTWSNKGLNMLKKGDTSFKHYLINYHISCLCSDASGRVWIGTDNGLFWFDQSADRFVPFKGPQLELDNIGIKSIFEDRNRNIWLTTGSTICKIDSSRNQLISFGEKYGVYNNSFNRVKLAASQTSQGEILLGNGDGYYYFFPQDLEANRYPTQLLFTDFFIDNKIIKPSDEQQNVLTSPIDETHELNLSHSQNNISFNFLGIQYASPENNSYLYKLENYDRDWRVAGSDKSASYFKLSPGKYTLRVKATSNNGIWSERNIDITIQPPWWLTWWAFTLYGLLFAMVAYYIYRSQRQRIIRTERERTREKELVQAKEIEKAYTELKTTQTQLIQSEKMASLGELTAGIAHEIQNPLNFVNNFSEVNTELIGEMEKEIEDGNTAEIKSIAENIRQNLDKISHHGKRADAIVKSMLQHSRTSAGVKEPTDVNALADEYLRLSYHGLRAKDKSFNAHLETKLDERIGKLNIIPQDIGRVLLNIYNNAFYAVGERKRRLGEAYHPVVSLSTSLIHGKNGGPEKAEIRIADNGGGIPQQVLDKIFQPFFTTKPTGEGTGLGLSLSYDIVTKGHGGELSVETREGEGATFIILIPK